MRANEATRKLLQADPNAARALHAVLNIDFEKDFSAFIIEAHFTAKQIEKAAAEAGHTARESLIAVITAGGYRWSRERLTLATLDASGRFEIGYKIPYSISNILDHHTGRGDFETARKNNNFSVIICQRRENLTAENPHPVDLAARFKVENVRRWCYETGGPSYIGEIETRRTDDNGSRYTYNERGRVIYKGRDEYRDICELIDKSGYIVNRKRDELKRRAAALRAERSKNAYNASNNAAEIAGLRARFEAKKAEAIAALAAATTAAEFSAITDKIWKYNGVAGIFKEIERLEAREAAKDFSSVEAYRRTVDGIAAALANI